MARKSNVARKLVSGIEELMKANKISVHSGSGRILSPSLIKVNDEEIAIKKVIIATGSESALLPIHGLDLSGVLTTDDILELRKDV